MASGGGEETSSEAWVRRPRNRCKNLKERKAIRNYYEIVKRNSEELQTDLQDMGKNWKEEEKFNQISAQLEKTLSFRPPRPERIFSKNSIFRPAYDFLAANLTFKQVLADPTDPFLKLSEADGRRCAKSLSFFLRHGLAQGSYSTRDGSVPIEEVERSLEMGQEKILLSVSPDYDQDKKRRFAVMSLSYPDGSKTLTVAALGGHSVAVCSPPGHYILGKESLQQHCPLVHNTSAVKDIEASGFLSQQKRLGGINFCSKRNIYRQKSTHQIWLKFEDAKRASKDGITFFGNRFTEVFFCTGAWEYGKWSGKLPLQYLTIAERD